MSLLIKGMDMPGFCIDCPCGHVDNSEYPKQKLFCYGQYECPELDINTTRCEVKNCPLVEVPTFHGRLIDADKTVTAILMMSNHPCGHAIENISDVVDWLKIKDNNIAFPTVIEAEE